MKVALFKKRPVVVEAILFDGENWAEVQKFASGGPMGSGMEAMFTRDDVHYIRLITFEGVTEASPGDWIIKGTQGEFYPCKPEVFDETYKMVEAIELGDVDVDVEKLKELTSYMGDRSDLELWALIEDACRSRTDWWRAYGQLRSRLTEPPLPFTAGRFGP